jgi:hypothetical protein
MFHEKNTQGVEGRSIWGNGGIMIGRGKPKKIRKKPAPVTLDQPRFLHEATGD